MRTSYVGRILWFGFFTSHGRKSFEKIIFKVLDIRKNVKQ
jgi:hypothetical protein